MKRSDRLMAILMALQQRQETAQSLADKLEVSRRTVLRDMQSLSEIGVPIYAISGPTGGYRLVEGYKLPPLQLDAQEALAVLFALRATTKLADSPFNRARWTALDKLRAAMPPRTLNEIEPLLQQVELEVPERKASAPYLTALIEHTASGAWISAQYRSERRRSELLLRPQRVYTAHGFWYCEAYSAEHDEVRTFRVDRFESVIVTEAPETAPKLDTAAADADKETDNRASATTRIVARLTYRGALLLEQDPHVGELVKQLTSDEWELDFQCPASEWGWAVRLFFTLGMDAEVIEPQELRRQLHQMFNQLADRYKAAEGEDSLE
ncbi:helix-turn-helix transcriptional regulator [Paenibacillus xylaniclasticus]|uniref:helix-turn-helix transcriptional regulator n=1 Tax=Paenibacillus xylaniclasticus TaxID=588083 RepID=UPI000FD79C49|nr:MULTISPECIES: YafY family protein [Paenibacillus]GFN34059.1 hypothetical protein PCURB6_43190 [Paenibacillus curdlanolyticus]